MNRQGSCNILNSGKKVPCYLDSDLEVRRIPTGGVSGKETILSVAQKGKTIEGPSLATRAGLQGRVFRIC
jgi:hypothetical protein